MSYTFEQYFVIMAYSAQTTQQQIVQNSSSDNLSFLGKKLNEEVPIVIKKILFGCGFINKFLISQINKDTISSIECFVNDIPDYSDSILKGTTYENIKPFKLLPAHQLLILSLPKYVQADKKNKQNKTSKSHHELKQTLIQKLQHYTESSEIEFNWSIDSISNFREVNSIFKCKVQCPACNRTISCQFKTYWQVSNFQLHLKSHLKSNNQTQQIENRIFEQEEFEVDENQQGVRINKQQNIDILNVLSP